MNEPQECVFASKCLGATCAPGYEKVLCDTCSAHFFAAPGSKCLPCSDRVITNFWLVLSAFIIFVVFVLVHTCLNTRFWEAWSSDSFSKVAQPLIGTHIQRLVLLNSLALPFPSFFKDALNWASRIVLNGVVGPECFTDKWSFRLFWSLVVGAVSSFIVVTFVFEFARELWWQRRGIPSGVRKLNGAPAAPTDWIREPRVLSEAWAETWAKVRDTPRVAGQKFDHEVDRLHIYHFWRGMRLNPLMSAMRFLGSGLLLQVSFKALAYRTVGGVKKQAGDENANYDAPDNVPVLVFSGIVVLLAVVAIAFLTLVRCIITKDCTLCTCGRQETVKVTSKRVLVVNPMVSAVTMPTRGSTGSSAYDASMQIKVRDDPTPWALHIYEMANFLSALAQVPDIVYGNTLGQTISASMLLVIDLLALLIISWLFLMQSASRGICKPVLLVLVFALAIMTQGVAVWCIKTASDADGTCGKSAASESWGGVLSVLNGGLVIVLGGFMAMRMCCCRVLFVSRARRGASQRCCAADYSVDPTPPLERGVSFEALMRFCVVSISL